MKLSSIKYENKNKNEVTERTVLISKAVKDTKAAIQTFDVTDASEEDIALIESAYDKYEEYLKSIPSFDAFMGDMYGESAPKLKHRRFLEENVTYIDSSKTINS